MPKPKLFVPVDSDYLVPFDNDFMIKKAATKPDDDPGKQLNIEALEAAIAKLNKVQQKLYANNRFSVLLVFQALDAAGKDGTIRAVLTGLNPSGCEVHSYKAPTSEELEHDFLWRVSKDLPERGHIGVWNRSHYEEVLVVRVHPEYLAAQNLPRKLDLDELFEERYESIVEAEKHWARNGCVIIKFFLNVSQKEQHERFLDRINEPESHWKFGTGDFDESQHWDEYMDAYQAALRATSKPWAPWYCIPADSKSYMRKTIAEIIVKTVAQLDLPYPQLSEKARAEMERVKKILEEEKK